MSIAGHAIRLGEGGAIEYIPPPCVKLRRTYSFVKMPGYKTPGSACFDLACLFGATIERGQGHTFQTGLEIELPEGYMLEIHSRSGHGFDHGLRLANCTGIIDSDYRGELMVRLVNDDPDNAYTVKGGERVAQARVVKAIQYPIIEVKELTETKRGRGGFGSTGRV